jgi:hypothetical protein
MYRRVEWLHMVCPIDRWDMTTEAGEWADDRDKRVWLKKANQRADLWFARWKVPIHDRQVFPVPDQSWDGLHPALAVKGVSDGLTALLSPFRLLHLEQGEQVVHGPNVFHFENSRWRAL